MNQNKKEWLFCWKLSGVVQQDQVCYNKPIATAATVSRRIAIWESDDDQEVFKNQLLCSDSHMRLANCHSSSSHLCFHL
jgi:hypothetical protein